MLRDLGPCTSALSKGSWQLLGPWQEKLHLRGHWEPPAVDLGLISSAPSRRDGKASWDEAAAKGLQERECPSSRHCPGWGDRDRDKLLTCRWHSSLWTIPFPKLGSKERTGFHCSGAEKPPISADYPCARVWHPRAQAQAEISPRQGQAPHRECCQHCPHSPSPAQARAVLAQGREILVTKQGQA